MPAVRTTPHWVTRLDELHLLTPLRVVLIVLTALVLTVVVRAVISRSARRTIVVPGTDRARAEARQTAVAGMLRSAVVGVVWTAAVITIISELGVNIGGVVATTTIIGGAVAFGAQTLIRDVIAGFFVLAEDQFGVGDDVDLGLCRGVVERVTVRSVRLRDGEGRRWYVAHGNVPRVANLSQSGSVVLSVDVARATAPAAAEGFVRALAAQVEGAEVIGLTSVADDRLTYQVRVPIGLGRSASEVHRSWRAAVLDAFAGSDEIHPPSVPGA